MRALAYNRPLTEMIKRLCKAEDKSAQDDYSRLESGSAMRELVRVQHEIGFSSKSTSQ